MPQPRLKLIKPVREAATPKTGHDKPQRFAFLLPNLGGGGVQRNTLITATSLANIGYKVDIVLCSDKGPLRQQVPDSINVVLLDQHTMWRSQWCAFKNNLRYASALSLPVLATLKPSKTLRHLPSLVDYLQTHTPDALVAANTHQNVEAVLARNAAKVNTRVIATQSTTFSSWHQISGEWRRRYLLPLLRKCYADADAVVSVSDAVADDLANYAQLDREHISTIYTPLIPQDLDSKVSEPIEHPWFKDKTQAIVLAVGRPGRAKDYPTLLRAFERVRKQHACRLVILGEVRDPGKNHERLEELLLLASELGICEDIEFLGYSRNPYRFMAQASLLVLSSLYEGFPSVIPEALACGCPVVSTDCPGGAAEALDYGEHGRLVPVGDDAALAHAICKTLDSQTDTDKLKAAGTRYSVTRCRDSYESLLLKLLDQD